MKRLGIAAGMLACVVCLSGIACCFPITAFAEEGAVSFEDKVTFSLNEEIQAYDVNQIDSFTSDKVYVTSPLVLSIILPTTKPHTKTPKRIKSAIRIIRSWS